MPGQGGKREREVMDQYEWQKHAKGPYQMVGSRVTCNPAPTNTDEDWLVLDLGGFLSRWLDENGFDLCGKDYDDSDMSVFRKGELNILCMHDEEQFRLFILATSLAKRFNLLDKCDRVALFEAVRYGREYNHYTLDNPF